MVLRSSVQGRRGFVRRGLGPADEKNLKLGVDPGSVLVENSRDEERRPHPHEHQKPNHGLYVLYVYPAAERYGHIRPALS